MATALVALAFLQPWHTLASPAAIGLLATTTGDFTYQGRLTNALGQPVPNGSYVLTFRLYEDATTPTALATTVQTPTVTNGLFVATLAGFSSYADGRDLYLGVQVGSDPELTPRQRITPVPYALSLRPGAIISDARSSSILFPPSSRAILRVRNTATTSSPFIFAGPAISAEGEDGSGLYAVSTGGSGVLGSTSSVVTGTAGVAGIGPPGGNAFYAGGSGKIASVATSTVWINGAAFTLDLPNDLSWNVQPDGSTRFTAPAAPGALNLYYPLNLTSRLYGTNATVTKVTVHYRVSNSSNAYILATELRRSRPTGSFDTMVSDLTNRTSTTAASYELVPSGNNLLSAASGGFLRFWLQFSNTTDYVQIIAIVVELKYEQQS
ncbi:MAG: hypothetical protein KatS3mg061_3282 [Dehalococcoidia bacterium]|nr:MAG: hypothetical protein KatS3mg061_3282 [Dehalococcoidia bacterium]